MTKEKLTHQDISKLANDIANELRTMEAATDVIIYYNNQRMNAETGEIEHNIDPHEYFEYAAYNHILSMSFEGFLYYYMDRHYKLPDKIEKLLAEANLCYELGDSWNLTCFPNNDNIEIEYTYYEKEPESIHVSYNFRESCPEKYLIPIMETWYELGSKEPDYGCCVIGEHMSFTLNNKLYHMTPYTGKQGDYTWTKYVGLIKSLLEGVGATNIIWHPGTLD